jgi:glycosyltransferase involved in cell wall biosynthesis
MKRVLFVTWDGPDQNYLESLFLPIFSATSRFGFNFGVLQFRWGSPEQTEQIRAAANARGMGYRNIAIRRRPRALGALASIAHGAAVLRAMLASQEIDLVLPRSILPAQIVSLVSPRVPVLFDADGLPADERVEFGGWSAQGAFYRAWRDIEAEAVRRAHMTITRTSHAKEVLLARAGPSVEAERISVVPNGKDEGIFRPAAPEERAATRAKLGIPLHAPWVVFAGSIGPQYCPRELLRFYRLLQQRKADAHLTVLTAQGAELREILTQEGLVPANVDVSRALPHEVPEYLAAADLGLAFRRPSFSQRAVSPIKVGEYLLCGLPVLATCGVGDLDVQVPPEAGKLLTELTPATLASAVAWFMDDVMPQRDAYRLAARQAGLSSFSISTCAERYADALHRTLWGAQPA